ncbi:hypothetical protein [Micromonospora maritima]|uniref:hypothetical protein n=1 Tax=Micromonospora maritima TaxID=986711 RepID=UPI00157D5E1A|nr:hypothetical protein [Micromonospora maritima]
MILDDLLTDDAPGVAKLTDPDAGQMPPCPCYGCAKRVPGAMPGWHLRKGPAPLLGARQRAAQLGPPDVRRWEFLEHGDHGDGRELLIPTWVDHPYRLRLRDGRWRYVAEPYELDAAAAADLAHLAANGYEVTVTAWQARHYPGHTLAVSITPEATR